VTVRDRESLSSYPAENSTAVRINKLALWLSRHWLRLVLVVLAVYVGLPVAAPVLMAAGASQPAGVIYQLYAPLCHQFAFRSIFLFGEQPVYPRGDAAPAGIKPIEAYAGEIQAALGRPVNMNDWTLDLQIAAKNFVGTPRMGYKIAICGRDVAIYFMLLCGGLIYAIPYVRRRLRPVPLWLYVLLGIAPIAIDGVSQLLGYPPFNLWPPRETLPIFRMLTGALFGLMNAWLAFPYIEESAHMTVVDLERKFAARRLRAEQLISQ
jgi:uncharacterized membrane protein